MLQVLNIFLKQYKSITMQCELALCYHTVLIYRRLWDHILVESEFFTVSCSHHIAVLHCTKSYYTKVVYF